MQPAQPSRAQGPAASGMEALLREVLRRRAAPQAWAWLEKALEAASGAVHANTLLGYYAGASRRMGKVALALDGAEQTRARELDPLLALGRWGADEAARALLLLTLSHSVAGEPYGELVQQCYELGDSREQESWLRALSLLPAPERFLAAAVDACRTNILPLFEAIACENPYPLRCFPELNFNQMVLKCLFNGIALARIVGLEERVNAELSRMADDYAAEREAAGRPVPADIWLALAPRATPARLERVYRYLNEGSPEHRRWAAQGLAQAGGDRSRQALAARRQVEQESQVREAIDSALARMR